MIVQLTSNPKYQEKLDYLVEYERKAFLEMSRYMTPDQMSEFDLDYEKNDGNFKESDASYYCFGAQGSLSFILWLDALQRYKIVFRQAPQLNLGFSGLHEVNSSTTIIRSA
jgi:hypothetical protein